MEEKDEISFEENNQPPKSSTGLDENIAGLICYLGFFVSGIIFAILEKDSKFVKFHAMQSAVVFLSLWIVGYVIGFLPFIGWLLSTLLSFTSFILWIVFMVKAYNHQLFRVPIASDIADNLIDKLDNPSNKDS